MKTATTKEVRKLVKDVFGIAGARMDKAAGENMRNMMFVCFRMDNDFCEKVTKVFRDNGFDNRVKVTQGCYLRIKAVLA